MESFRQLVSATMTPKRAKNVLANAKRGEGVVVGIAANSVWVRTMTDNAETVER